AEIQQLPRGFLLGNHEFSGRGSGGKRRSRYDCGLARRGVVGVTLNRGSGLTSNIEKVAGGIEEGKLPASGQTEGRAGDFLECAVGRSNGETPDGVTGTRTYRIDKSAAGIDGDGGGADARGGGKGRTQNCGQFAGIGIDAERGDVAYGRLIRRRIVGLRIYYIQKLVTAVDRQGGRSLSRRKRRKWHRSEHTSCAGTLRLRSALWRAEHEATDHSEYGIDSIDKLAGMGEQNLRGTLVRVEG